MNKSKSGNNDWGDLDRRTNHLQTGPVASAELDSDLADEVAEMANTDPRLCYSCLSCAGGCPFVRAMDLGPHGVMRSVVYGLRADILHSNTIWICVGCHTCSAVCPMAIDIAAVMDSLRNLALKEGGRPAEPSILDFHRSVLASIERNGRANKLEIMLQYKATPKRWFQDWDLGLDMLAKHKLDLRPSRIKDPRDLKSLFAKAWRK
ncbi:MAG: 4Fe-4S dicluster domain-containing protein [Deltaproteobacteria bacterium]|nr:4Fe-4S dicluster domain-containing protein [Deltaproteobacteria bacterium]